MRKILYISGTRADYGLMRQTLFCIKAHPGLKAEIVATGMHLMPEFGKTINEIRKDKFKIHELPAVYKCDSKKSIVNFISEFILKLTKSIKWIKPDIILILGDRPEMLASAIVGAYLTIPIVHIHGGDVSSTIDEVARHAITKLSHVHLAATRKAAERIIKMGEDSWRVHIVGAPGLDSILNESLCSKKEITRKYNLDLSNPILLVVQHPVTAEIENAKTHMVETMEAIRALKYQSIVVFPNSDAGGRKIIQVIKGYKKYSFIQIHRSIPHRDYLTLMNVATAMIGNSSSAIIEAPSFHLPVVNIGTRQEGRERAENIIDVDYDRGEIKEAVKRAIYNKSFRERVKKCRSSYGNGKAGKRIAGVLSKVKIDKKLLHKKITY